MILPEGILKGVYDTIHELIELDPERTTAEGILLIKLAEAVNEYDRHLYPELD